MFHDYIAPEIGHLKLVSVSTIHISGILKRMKIRIMD
jgi:hypothetical protein|tara:strand:- start:10 stop:120 length:111 start_codon:yes stop_codon:yes gene_type:complete